MNRRRIFALGGATLALTLTPAAAFAAKSSGSPSVTIRIEGLNKTLLVPTTVKVPSGYITRYGAGAKKCPGHSVQGALQVATRGKWAGTWYSSYNEYLVTSILGEKPKGSNFWELFVNNKGASLGACDIKARPGQQILFADETGAANPSGLSAPHSAVAGKSFKVKLVGYNTKGSSTPLAGVTVTGNGITPVKTDSHGDATITDAHSGVLVLRANPKKYVRTEAVVHIAA
jgi:Domain of unknown function (DUF4430)